MSDYIDENFDIDETDEYWDFDKLPCHQMTPHQNDINAVN